MTYPRILVTIGVLLLYRLGCQIPLPGLDPEVLGRLHGMGGATIEHLSIFALGVMPIFSVLLIVELAKIVFPALSRWQTASRHNAERLHRYVHIAALALAALQALGVANALEEISNLVAQPGWEFRIGVVTTFVGATALLGWLGGRITLHGFGNGFWLLLITPTLASLPNAVAGGFTLWQRGDVGASALLATVGYLAVATGLLITVTKAHYGAIARSDLSPGVSPTVQSGESEFADVWPPLLATYVGGFLIAIAVMPLIGNGGSTGDPIIAIGSPVRLLVIAVLIAIFTALRDRSPQASMDGEPLDEASAARRARFIALTQIVICVGGELLTRYSGLPVVIDGSWLIVIVIAAMNVLASINIDAASRLPVGQQ